MEWYNRFRRKHHQGPCTAPAELRACLLPFPVFSHLHNPIRHHDSLVLRQVLELCSHNLTSSVPVPDRLSTVLLSSPPVASPFTSLFHQHHLHFYYYTIVLSDYCRLRETLIFALIFSYFLTLSHLERISSAALTSSQWPRKLTKVSSPRSKMRVSVAFAIRSSARSFGALNRTYTCDALWFKLALLLLQQPSNTWRQAFPAINIDRNADIRLQSLRRNIPRLRPRC